MKRIPFLKPNLVRKKAYQKYLAQIDASRLYSNYGPLNSLFERRVLEEYFRSEGDLTTVNNATIGLMLAISQTKRRGGRYALMPSFTFPATPLAAMWCGLEPYFIDIRADDWCMDESVLTETLDRLGSQAACVVAYATFGTCMDLSLYESLHRTGMPVIIDAASSFGASSDGGMFGCGFSGPVVYSLHATKTFGIGEGGMVYSSDRDLIRNLRQAGNFGFSADRVSVTLGLNGKLSEYAAAIALATLDVFQEKMQTRLQISRWYVDAMTQKGLFDANWVEQKTLGTVPRQVNSFLCPPNRTNNVLIDLLREKGIEARSYFFPACHQQKTFEMFQHSGLETTEGISARVINLPTWEEMSKDDVWAVIDALAGGTAK
ncbi:MAG: aminotransferase class I/II-fold pyridoxal phosphate-dependent enzyme [Geobacteraceae bacterium]|nr:aminotransferase class I/II-fold pyridoxal phosphate-dependent enzyme [Geobacteraceae bacterium]